MEELIPEIITVVVTALAGLAATGARQWLKTVLTPQRLSAVGQLARVAVDAADEVARAAEGSFGPGDKFEYAEDFLKQGADRLGVKLTNQEANAFIHSVLNGQRAEVQTAIDMAVSDVLDQVLDNLGEEDEEEAA